MAEEKKEPWLNKMALATVILAVCATLSTFKGGGYSTLSIIDQTLASDQWSFYQAKSMKQHLFEVQVEALRLQAAALAAKNPAIAAYDKQIEIYRAAIERYKQEKKDIEAKARELEGQRDDARTRGKPFGTAVLLLQVAILLNSVAGLMKIQKVWWASIPVGLTGLFFFADGFFLFL